MEREPWMSGCKRSAEFADDFRKADRSGRREFFAAGLHRDHQRERGQHQPQRPDIQCGKGKHDGTQSEESLVAGFWGVKNTSTARGGRAHGATR